MVYNEYLRPVAGVQAVSTDSAQPVVLRPDRDFRLPVSGDVYRLWLRARRGGLLHPEFLSNRHIRSTPLVDISDVLRSVLHVELESRTQKNRPVLLQGHQYTYL